MKLSANTLAKGVILIQRVFSIKAKGLKVLVCLS